MSEDRSILATLADVDLAPIALSMRKRGYGTCVKLAERISTNPERAETLLCLGIAMHLRMGWSKAKICDEYRFTPAQVRHAVGKLTAAQSALVVSAVPLGRPRRPKAAQRWQRVVAIPI